MAPGDNVIVDRGFRESIELLKSYAVVSSRGSVAT